MFNHSIAPILEAQNGHGLRYGIFIAAHPGVAAHSGVADYPGVAAYLGVAVYPRITAYLAGR